MKSSIITVNILTITYSGVVVALMGLAMFFCRDFLSRHMLYLLPIPPISVAAYIFVFSYFKDNGGSLPDNMFSLILTILKATLMSSGIFFTVSILIMGLVIMTKRL